MRTLIHLRPAVAHSLSTRRRLLASWVFLVILGAGTGAVPASAVEVPFVAQSPIDGDAVTPLSVFAGDVDGDGDLDAVAAERQLDTITWYENPGDGSTWTAHEITTSAEQVLSVRSADVDGDGDLDVVAAAPFDDTPIAWYENTAGDGSAWTNRSVSSTISAQSAFPADVDGDGDVDVLFGVLPPEGVPGPDPGVGWYENTAGDGSAWSLHAISTSVEGAASLVAADVDGDGDLDVLSKNEVAGPDTIAWYENTAGDGSTWATHTVSTSAGSVESVVAVDVDGDGDIDVLSDETIEWHENAAGDGSAWVTHTIAVVADPVREVFAADVDGDGDPDALAVSSTGDSVAWYENTAGDGSGWQVHTLSTSTDGAGGVSAADVDGDGDVDVLATARFDGEIVWFRNDAIHRSALFPERNEVSPNASGAISVFPGDFDGDGDQDALEVSFNSSEITWAENLAGDGSAWTSHTISTGGFAVSAISADVDGDGDLDALSAVQSTDTIAWHENTAGDGSAWTTHILTTSALGAISVFAADVDGDGDLDVLSASFFDDTIAWYENTAGDGSAWVLHTITVSAVGARSVFAVDVDGDGDLDALSASHDDDTVAWHENTAGDGSAWTSHTITVSADGVNAVFAADVDGDGDVDALSAEFSLGGTIAWYENTAGDGSAWTDHTISSLTFSNAVLAADLDRDGDPDVLVGSNSEVEIAWYENTAGDGSAWASHDLSSDTDRAPDVAVADVDGDGDLDVLSATGPNKIYWYPNRGGQFALPTAAAAPARVIAGDSAVVLEIDLAHRGRAGDGDVELASLELYLTDAVGTPLTTAEANAVVRTMALFRDDGDGTFDPGSDTLVETFGFLTLDGGFATLPLADDDPDLATSVGAQPTFFLAAAWDPGAASATPDDLTITHVTASSGAGASSTGEDATYDLPLALEGTPDATAGPFEINDPPAAVADGPYEGDEDQTLAPAGSVLDNDVDEEDEGSLTAVLETGPANAASFTLQPDGTFSYTPVEHFSGMDAFSYRADDGLELSGPATVTLEVTPVADAPQLTVADATGVVDQPIPLSIASSLVDDDGSESLSIEIGGVPAGASLSAGVDQGGGVWLLAPGDLPGLEITPPPGDDSDFTLTVTAIATEGANGDQATTVDTLEVTVQSLLIFADGFESGDISAWD